MTNTETLTVDPLAARIVAYAEEVIAGTEAFVVEVQVRGHKGSRVVGVYLDSEAGLTVDELASFSRSLGFLLETEEVIDGRYKLEVSSPGADRPLLWPKQYPKHVGRSLSVRFQAPDDKPQKVKGELVSATAETITLTLKSGEDLTIAFDTIKEARVVLPW